MRSHCEDCGSLGNVPFSHPVQCLYSLYHHLLTSALRTRVVALQVMYHGTRICVNKPRYVVPHQAVSDLEENISACQLTCVWWWKHLACFHY